MGTLEQNLDSWSNYDWSKSGDEWSACWGGTDYLWNGTVLPRIQSFIPCETILEIAPGFGRITQYLKSYCNELLVVDLVERCIEACKQRFALSSNINYFVNDGKTLPIIQNRSIDLIFSWDSLVHAESDVMQSYIQEFARVLKPNGYGFIHHSNIGYYYHIKKEPVDNPHWRAESMNAELFNQYCDEAGLQCLTQEKIGWGDTVFNDCFSMFARKENPLAKSLQIYENENFMYEANRLCRISKFYNPNNF